MSIYQKKHILTHNINYKTKCKQHERRRMENNRIPKQITAYKTRVEVKFHKTTEDRTWNHNRSYELVPINVWKVLLSENIVRADEW